MTWPIEHESQVYQGTHNYLPLPLICVVAVSDRYSNLSVMAPPAKRARHAGSGTGRAPSSAECAKMVERLSMESAHAVLKRLMATSTEVLDAVEAELAQRDAKLVDLRHYADQTSEILYSLNGLRDSQVYNLAGDVYVKLTKLVEECKQTLSNTQAFQAMVKIVEVVEQEAERELRKRLISCGGIDEDIARELTKLVEDMSAEEKTSVENSVEDLDGVVSALEPYSCGQELAEVVKKIRGS